MKRGNRSNDCDCHGQQPEEITSVVPAQEDLDAAYIKCAALISDGYIVGEALYQKRGENDERKSIVRDFEAKNPGFSQASYERALRHGQTAAIF